MQGFRLQNKPCKAEGALTIHINNWFIFHRALIQGGDLTSGDTGGQGSEPSLRSGVEGEALGADLGAPGPAGGGRRAPGRVGSGAGEGGTLPESQEATADLKTQNPTA